MKALSIRQPYADLILYGFKFIETRGRNTSFRGRFLIHTSKQTDKEATEFYQLREKELKAPLGALVGTANLTRVIKYETADDFKGDILKHGCWWEPEPDELPKYGYILKDIAPLPVPTPFKGQLGFFKVPNLGEAANQKSKHKPIGRGPRLQRLQDKTCHQNAL